VVSVFPRRIRDAILTSFQVPPRLCKTEPDHAISPPLLLARPTQSRRGHSGRRFSHAAPTTVVKATNRPPDTIDNRVAPFAPTSLPA
jgi:hypothetical protein